MEEFFNLVLKAPDEQVVNAFTCKKNPINPISGCLFVSNRRCYFNPDVQGSNQSVELLFSDVIDVRRETFLFSSNTITLVTARVEYVFFNFNSFDSAFRTIQETRNLFIEDMRNKKLATQSPSLSAPSGISIQKSTRPLTNPSKSVSSLQTRGTPTGSQARLFSMKNARPQSTIGIGGSSRQGFGQIRSLIMSGSGGQSFTQGITVPGDVLLALELDTDEAVHMCTPCSLLQGQMVITTESLVFRSSFLGSSVQEEIKISHIMGIDTERTKICNYPVEVIRTRKKKHIFSFSKDPGRFHDIICSTCIELKLQSNTPTFERPFLESPLRKILKGDEEHVETVACGQYPEILLGGHLFITTKKLIFYSQLSNYKKKIVIPFHELWNISEENTFVRIRTKMDDFVFSSIREIEFFETTIRHSWREAYAIPSIRTEKLEVYNTQAYKEVNMADVDHAEYLFRLWRALNKETVQTNRKGMPSAVNRFDYRRAGFLEMNPCKELQKCGVYGLSLITYFAEKYTDEYMRILRMQIDPDSVIRSKWDPFSPGALEGQANQAPTSKSRVKQSSEYRIINSFPPGHTGVHVSLMILRMLELHIDTMTRSSPSPFFALVSLMIAGEENVLEEFFCVCMILFDGLFKEMEANETSFTTVLKTLEDRATVMLLQGPRNITDLWLVIEKLRRLSTRASGTRPSSSASISSSSPPPSAATS